MITAAIFIGGIFAVMGLGYPLACFAYWFMAKRNTITLREFMRRF